MTDKRALFFFVVVNFFYLISCDSITTLLDDSIQAYGGELNLRAILNSRMTFSLDFRSLEQPYTVAENQKDPLARLATSGVDVFAFQYKQPGYPFIRRESNQTNTAIPGSEVSQSYVTVLKNQRGLLKGKINLFAPDLEVGADAETARVLYREFVRFDPLFVFQLRRRAAALQDEGKRSYQGKDYLVISEEVTKYYFDEETKLLTHVVIMDTDSTLGDLQWIHHFSNFQLVSGVLVAHSQMIEALGQTVLNFSASLIEFDVFFDDKTFSLNGVHGPAAMRRIAKVDYQWFFSRYLIGLYSAPTTEIEATIENVGPSVYHVRASNGYNQLVVEYPKSLVLVDTPADHGFQLGYIEIIEDHFQKPIKTIVLTHTHFDHIRSLRDYVTLGVSKIYVGAPWGKFVSQVLTKKHTLRKDLLGSSKIELPDIVEVKNVTRIDEKGAGPVTELYREVDAVHQEGNLLIYVPQSKVGYVTDIWTPTTPLIPLAVTHFRQATQEFGWADDTLVCGGHGACQTLVELDEQIAALSTDS